MNRHTTSGENHFLNWRADYNRSRNDGQCSAKARKRTKCGRNCRVGELSTGGQVITVPLINRMSHDECKLRKTFGMAQYLPTIGPVSPGLSWYGADMEGAARLVPISLFPALADSRVNEVPQGSTKLKPKRLCRRQSWASRRKAYSEKNGSISETNSTRKEAA